MKKIILTMALAFAASVCFACTTSNNNSNVDASDESEYVSVNEPQQSNNSGAGTYTFKGTDGTNYKVVLKPRKDNCSKGQAVLYVNGKETDFGSWMEFVYAGCGLEVRFDDTFLKIPGQPSYSRVFYLKDGYAYAEGASESENPKKRVKYTKIK